MRQAVLTGSYLSPVLEVSFERGDTMMDDSVRAQPERRWNSEFRRWEVTGLISPVPVPVVTVTGLPVRVEDFYHPVAGPSDHSGYPVAVHPRLAGRDYVIAKVGPDHLWRGDSCLSREGFVDWTWAIGGGNPTGKTPTMGAESHSDAPALVYDGSLEALRHVPLTDLREVDVDTAASMNAVGIENVHDLLHTVPRRYIDMSNPELILNTAIDDDVAIVGTVSSTSPVSGPKKMAKATITDAAGTKLFCRWFHAGWNVRKLNVGQQVLVYGKMEEFTTNSFTGRAMTNPVMELVMDTGTKQIIGVYPASMKHELTPWQLHRAAVEAVERTKTLGDTVPAEIVAKRGLLERNLAFEAVHCPTSLDEAKRGRDRLAYDEFLRLQLALGIQRAETSADRGLVMVGDGHLRSRYLSKFPWPLTGAQQRCIDGIVEAAGRPNPLAGLLQGDVGTGKSAVTFMAMLNAVEAGHQAAMVVPIDSLATQHFEELREEMDGVLPEGSVELLTNRVTGKKRRAVLAGLASGEVKIVVGTHSLLSEKVVFDSLGFVAVDEQHKFGVKQRNALRERGPVIDGVQRMPDIIYASATPVPRSAVMTVFGDLQVFTIDEAPPGRSKKITHAVTSAPEDDPNDPVWGFIRSEAEKCHQAFVVCPSVESSATREAKAAHDTADRLRAGALAGLRIGVATGKMKPDELVEVMTEFKAGLLDVLVATTVIEVGINVPNATVIAILSCENFGLAQMHQLRGRVGRGKLDGTCFLVGEQKTKQGMARVKAMLKTTDGFILSEMDLRIRGTGTLLGSKQHGSASDMRVGNILDDTELVAWAKEDSETILGPDPKLVRHPHLRSEVNGVLGEEAGEWMVSQ